MQWPMQKRLARRMGTEEVGGLTLPQLQQIWCPQGDAPVRRLWGDSRHHAEAGLRLRILPRAVCMCFIVHCHCLEKQSCNGYQGSWLTSSWENTFHPVFPWHFCAEQPGWEQVRGHPDYLLSWALQPLWGLRPAWLGTLRCQGKAAAVSQESVSPYCLPTIAPVTPIESRSTAKPGEVGGTPLEKAPAKSPSLLSANILEKCLFVSPSFDFLQTV